MLSPKGVSTGLLPTEGRSFTSLRSKAVEKTRGRKGVVWKAIGEQQKEKNKKLASGLKKDIARKQ